MCIRLTSFLAVSHTVTVLFLKSNYGGFGPVVTLINEHFCKLSIGRKIIRFQLKHALANVIHVEKLLAILQLFQLMD